MACARSAIDIADGPSGLVVDGQQRLTALSQVGRDFQVFVSALICKDEAELRRQFVLINNTRPLPKSLIYELLPTVDDLPARLSKRSQAAESDGSAQFQEEFVASRSHQDAYSAGWRDCGHGRSSGSSWNHCPMA